jgi:hypothetical protein
MEADEEKDVNMQDYFFNMRNLKGKKRAKYMTEYDNNQAKIDKSFKDWNDHVKREPGSL